jgi:TonB family protein
VTETLAASPLAQAIGLALVEFVWQGALIGIATALVLAALRRSTADARYIVACLGLSAMTLAPIATTTYHARSATTPSNQAAATTPLMDADARTLPETASASGDLFTTDAAAMDEAVSRSLSSRLRPWLPTIVVFWIGGVAALSLNLIRGWIQARRLLRHAAAMSASVWPVRMRLMADRLGVEVKIRLVKSAVVDVPAVIGWLRPAIIVPMSVLAGLSPAHIDAILAHELSHIRRRDYLVNIVQCVVETLLFYHPAVWWVSRRIRLEREHCCDDLAASLCDSRLTYATALASLETLRAATPTLVMPATGGVLLHRIRRLVDPRCPSIPEFSGGFAMCVVATLLFLVSQLTASPPSPVVEAEPAVAVAANSAPLLAAPEPVTVKRQTTQGSIEGTVMDPSGGIIPGARVVLTSAVSAATRSTTTDVRGRFVFADVAAGAYDVTVSLVGFKTSKGRVQLSDGFRAAMEVRLEMGSVTETVVLQGTQPPAGGRGAQGAAPRSAMAHLEAARQYYQQGRLSEAEAMTAQALQLLRAEMSQRMFPMVEPRATPAAAGEPKPGVVNAIRVGGSIREPRKTRHVNPIYPAEAQAAAIQGYVIIEALIGTDGAVKEARVIGGETVLADAALTAVRQWEYTPTLLNGVPVEVIMNVTVHFKLGGV